MADLLGTIYAEIRLTLDQFRQDIADANTEIRTMQDDVSRSLSAYSEMGGNLKKVGGAMTKYVTAPIVGLGTAAVYTGAKFDSAMSEVMAISGATGEEFEALRAQARNLGAETKFTATEAAQGMTMLAMAGFNTEEIMSAMPGMLSLAAAGNLELGSAANIVASTLRSFGENADQAGRYADVFAKAAASGNTDVQGLGEAMSYGAPTAASMGMAVEEAAAIMVAFADAGIQSSRAGTTFEAVMRDLRNSAMQGGGALRYTTQAGEEMSVAWYDAEGNARPFLDVLRDLEAQLQGATTAERDFVMQQLVQTAGQRGLNILLTRGSESLGELTNSLYDSSGAADDMSETMLNNLAGSMTLLRSALDEVMIGFSDVLAPIIQKVAEGLTKLAQWFGNLSPTTKTVITVILALVAVFGPLLFIIGAFLAMIPAMATGFGIISAAAAPILLPILAIVAAIAAIIAIGVALYKNWDKIKEFAGNLWEGIKSGWESLVEGIKNLFIAIGEFFVGIWDSIKTTFSNAITAIVEWFAGLRERIATGLENFVNAVGTAISNVVTFFSELPGKIWTWLLNVIDKIKEFGGNVLDKAKDAGQKLIDGFMNIVTGLPGLIWDTLMSVGSKLVEAGSALWNKAKDAAGRLWEGFKKGLGISSPSYLEEAMFDIVDTGKWMLDSMKSDFRTLGNIKVNPPSLSNMGSTLKKDIDEVSRLIGRDQQFVFDGAVTGSTEQVVRHEHAGVLEIRGTNDEGQLVDVVRVVMDELRREVRT